MSVDTSPALTEPGQSPSVDRGRSSLGQTPWAWALIAAVAAYLLLPGHPLGLLHGVPLDALGLGALLGFGIGLFGFGLPRGGRGLRLLALLALALQAIKLVLWWTAPDYGLAASYYARSRPTGQIE